MGDADVIICRVCGDELLPDGAVACRACGTPHHQDCWKFAGGCSVYGCGSARSTTYVPQTSSGLEHRVYPDEVMAITETTPVPAAYRRRRDSFPSPAYFAVMSYTNSLTGLKLFGTGVLIWGASMLLSNLVQPFMFFSVAGFVLVLLSPIYWIAASVLGIVSLSTGLVDGRIERKAVYGLMIGSAIPLIASVLFDIGGVVVGGAAVLFAGCFLMQLIRNGLSDKYG